MTRAHRRLIAALAAGLLALTACTGIPDSSGPQTIAPVAVGDAPKPSPPPKGLSARDIVAKFLQAGASGDSRHAAAREYLTAAASSNWSDDDAIVVSGISNIPNPTPAGVISFTAVVAGRVNADGVYTSATSSTPTTFTFRVAQVGGQNRIAGLGSGVILTSAQFVASYYQQAVYFCSASSGRTCSYVPDLRWTTIQTTDSTHLATWLVQQAVGAPRPELTDAVETDVFPAQATAATVGARFVDGTLRVEIPGSSRVSGTERDRIAGVLARTLEQLARTFSITITDNGVPVSIPTVGGGPAFDPSDFDDTSPPPNSLYYVDSDGHIRQLVGHTGTLVPGAFGIYEDYQVKTAALTRAANGSLEIAATTGTPPATGKLYLDTPATGVRDTKLSGPLTRPCWAPGHTEAWVGSGSTLYRVTVAGTTLHTYAVPSALPVAGNGVQYSSIRFSPDGNQVALTVKSAPVSGQSGVPVSVLYIGAVLRTAGTVRVVGLTQISPPGYFVSDADWSAPNKLNTIASSPGNYGSLSVYDTDSDGSQWTPYSTLLLPSSPENITSSTNGTWVESEGELFTEDGGGGWSSPSLTGTLDGTQPVFES